MTGGIAFMMIGGGIAHVANPSVYSAMIPSFIPENVANGLAVVAELGVGAMVLFPKTRRLGALAFTGLMTAFMPIHIWDALKDNPAIGPTPIAWVRVGAQVGLMYLGYALASRVAKKDGVNTFALPKA